MARLRSLVSLSCLIGCGGASGADPDPDGQPVAVCTPPTLAVTPDPVVVGDTLIVTAQADCDGGDPEFRLSVRDPGGVWAEVRGWGPSPLAWSTASAAPGPHRLVVGVRTAGTFDDSVADTIEDVVIDEPPAGPQLRVAMAGAGAGHMTTPLGYCLTPSTCSFDGTEGEEVALHANTVGDSAWAGWSGACAGDATSCFTTVPAEVTATFAPLAGVDWVSSGPYRVADVAWAGDHAVLVGSTVPGALESQVWLGRVTPSGVVSTTATDGVGRAYAVARAAGGALVVAAGSSASHVFVVRKYAADGTRLWSVSPGGGAYEPRHGPALDADGNIYVVGDDGTGYLVSYTPDGVERWRVRPPGATLLAVAVRGELVVVGGEVAGDAWIGTYDRAGAPGWDYGWSTTSPPAIGGLGIDGDGDVVYISSASVSPLVMGSVAAGGAAEQWQRLHYAADGGSVDVLADDSVLVAGAADLSVILHYGEAGDLLDERQVRGLVGGVVATGTHLYVGAHDSWWSAAVIERLPWP